MASLVTYLSYDETKNSFTWDGSRENLKDFICFALNAEDANDEWNADPSHSAFTFKLNGCTTRFYSTTKRLVLLGQNHILLRDKFLELLPNHDAAPLDNVPEQDKDMSQEVIPVDSSSYSTIDTETLTESSNTSLSLDETRQINDETSEISSLTSVLDPANPRTIRISRG